MVYVHAKICVTFFLLLLLMINFVKIFGKLKKSFEKKKTKREINFFFHFFIVKKKEININFFKQQLKKKKIYKTFFN